MLRFFSFVFFSSSLLTKQKNRTKQPPPPQGVRAGGGGVAPPNITPPTLRPLPALTTGKTVRRGMDFRIWVHGFPHLIASAGAVLSTSGWLRSSAKEMLEQNRRPGPCAGVHLLVLSAVPFFSVYDLRPRTYDLGEPIHRAKEKKDNSTGN